MSENSKRSIFVDFVELIAICLDLIGSLCWTFGSLFAFIGMMIFLTKGFNEAFIELLLSLLALIFCPVTKYLAGKIVPDSSTSVLPLGF